jgi:hypothetical protein
VIARTCSRVLPVLRTGLHCGPSTQTPVGTPWDRVLPVLRTGLHCGSFPCLNGVRSCYPCSRSSGPGSIAAFPAGVCLVELFVCSRSSGPGSIAAQRRSGCCGLRETVLPVLRTGLHCGRPACPTRSRSRSRCSRSSGPGSIAAVMLSGSTAGSGTCSRSSGPGSIAAGHAGRPVCCVCGACSRSSGPGSIAASRESHTRSTNTKCSRSSGPGSIAARKLRAAVLAENARAPGPQDRAPLRRRRRLSGRDRGRVVRPVLRTGLHCGVISENVRRRHLTTCSRSSGPGSIAAAPPVSRIHGDFGVLPVLRTGLHCGDPYRAWTMPIWAGSAPGPQDRAPLRHLGLRGSGQLVTGRAPGPQDRAPLRLPTRLNRYCSGVQVLPVLRTGLHCGWAPTHGGGSEVHRCSRSSGPGSIAATNSRRGMSGAHSSAPGPQDRAPLRRVRIGAGHLQPGSGGAPGPQDRAPLRPRRACVDR